MTTRIVDDRSEMSTSTLRAALAHDCRVVVIGKLFKRVVAHAVLHILILCMSSPQVLHVLRRSDVRDDLDHDAHV